MALQTAWPWPYWLHLHLKGMLGLLKALAELGRLDLPVVGFSFGHYIRCAGRRFWLNPVLILFDWQMLLVLSLLGVGRGEEITF